MSRPSVCGCDACRRRVDVARWPFALVALLVAAALLVGCAPKRPPCEDYSLVVDITVGGGVMVPLEAACRAPMRLSYVERQDEVVVAACVCP